jgi:hypothetical protein
MRSPMCLFGDEALRGLGVDLGLLGFFGFDHCRARPFGAS